MSDREALIQAILDAPDEDAPRLVFADWQDEHGNQSHAELIRVQCELARLGRSGDHTIRKRLGLRQAGLLARRELRDGLPPGCVYRRGFVNDFPVGVQVADGRLRFWLLPDAHRNPRENLDVPPDRVLDVALHFTRTPMTEPISEAHAERLTGLRWAMRITTLHFFGTACSGPALHMLAESGCLRNVVSLRFHGVAAPAEAVAAVALSAAPGRLRELWLEWHWRYHRLDPTAFPLPETPDIDAILRRIASSLSMTGLKRLSVEGVSHSTEVVGELLASPHLASLTEVNLRPIAEPPPEQRDEIDRRFRPWFA
jgi:uncharacterized protein (TIGR02996 family)